MITKPAAVVLLQEKYRFQNSSLLLVSQFRFDFRLIFGNLSENFLASDWFWGISAESWECKNSVFLRVPIRMQGKKYENFTLLVFDQEMDEGTYQPNPFSSKDNSPCRVRELDKEKRDRERAVEAEIFDSAGGNVSEQ